MQGWCVALFSISPCTLGLGDLAPSQVGDTRTGGAGGSFGVLLSAFLPCCQEEGIGKGEGNEEDEEKGERGSSPLLPLPFPPPSCEHPSLEEGLSSCTWGHGEWGAPWGRTQPSSLCFGAVTSQTNHETPISVWQSQYHKVLHVDPRSFGSYICDFIPISASTPNIIKVVMASTHIRNFPK